MFWQGIRTLKRIRAGQILAGFLPALLLAMAGGAAYLGRLPAFLWSWPAADKLLHFVLYGLWAAGLETGFPGAGLRLPQVKLPLAVALPALASLADELLQTQFPLRGVEALDVLFSWAGLLCFWGLASAAAGRRGLLRALPGGSVEVDGKDQPHS